MTEAEPLPSHEQPAAKPAGRRGRSVAPQRRCRAGSAIEILQEKWVLHIIHALLAGPKGFNELGREVGGCNPTTLTHRLARLEAIGVIHKEVHSTQPPRCSYQLTDSGRDLESVITAIKGWALEHLP